MTSVVGWQPIETAPKDRFILVAVPGSEEMVGFVAWAKWQGNNWHGVDDEGLTYAPRMAFYGPTHWMPLPAPPSSGEV